MQTSIVQLNKTHQKVIGTKFVFKMSTVHINTCTLNDYVAVQLPRNDGEVQQSPLGTTPSANVLLTP